MRSMLPSGYQHEARLWINRLNDSRIYLALGRGIAACFLAAAFFDSELMSLLIGNLMQVALALNFDLDPTVSCCSRKRH